MRADVSRTSGSWRATDHRRAVGEGLRPYLIAIAGPSCSGKTLLAERVARRLGRRRTAVLPLDAYYRDRSHLDLPARRRCNFDEPAAVEWSLLRRQVLALAAGREIERPVYDFARCTRRRATVTVRPVRFLIVEGLFALHRPWLRRLCRTKVFVEVGEEEARCRRLRRDVGERGSPLDFVTRQYEETVRPMARRHILPTRRHADLVISGDAASGREVAAILEHLRRQVGARS